MYYQSMKKPEVFIQYEAVKGKELYNVHWARRQGCLVANTITSILQVTQKLTILLALLLQNLVQGLERPFRKDVSSKERFDLVAAPSILDAPCTISSLQAFTDTVYKLLKRVIPNKSTNK